MSENILIKTRTPFVLLLSLASVLTLADIVSDYKEGTDLVHLWLEGSIVLLCLIGISYLFIGFRKTTLKLRAELDQTRQDLGFWKQRSESFITGLALAIDEQFNKWDLTPSEKEVALFLIKGLSTKEISDLRSASEKTVRAQATSIYKKANVHGRHELSAFFLEDLLLPQSQS